MVLTVKKAAEMMLVTGKRKSKGFLLLEAMVSVTILAVSLVLIAGSFMKSIKAKELSEDYFKAGLLLEEKTCELNNTDMKEGISEGVFNNFGNRFSWNLIVAKLNEEPLKEISLEVSWMEGNKRQSMSMLTYLYVPAAPAI